MLLDTEIPITDNEMRLFHSLVRERTGIRLQKDKRTLLNNRLAARLRYHGCESFEAYYHHLLHSDPYGQELQEMINALTTNMTSFFREKHHFDVLARRLLSPARQLALKGQAPSIRIWSAGCSTGEEAVSLAITVAESLDHLPTWDVKILGTDIDTKVLEICRTGVYRREAVKDLAPDILKKYFLSGQHEYQGYVRIKPSLHKLISFARLNLIDDLWPIRCKFDAIFCRNVIIYFDHDIQSKLVQRFAEYLKPNGLFFAGHSENLFWLSDVLESIGGTAYRIRNRKQEP